MKLTILLLVIVMIVISIVCLIIGAINYYFLKKKKNNTELFYWEEVFEVFSDIFSDVASFYFAICVIMLILYFGVITNGNSYSPNKEIKEEKIMLEKMAVYNNKYINKIDGYYEYLPSGQGDIKVASDYYDVKFFSSKTENYLIIKYNTYQKKSRLPDWLIDGWANKKEKKHIISYIFYTK